MTDGILLVDKPAGMTSFGVVARVRRIFSQQYGTKIKVGHCGTLDPFATGLLLLCIGKECKNANLYLKHDKVYEATFRLGKVSTTGDPEGIISNMSEYIPTEKEIRQVLQEFEGHLMQAPPMHSAIKINGKRAYQRARSGENFEIPSRAVTIYDIELNSYSYPELNVTTKVSSGTYIRSLAKDIGESLKTGAYCADLRRIKIGNYDVKDAQSLEQLGITS